MKFSTLEEFGIRCLVQIARAGPSGALTIPEISEREGLSEANVAKVLRLLRQEGFVVASRGKTGGYALTRPAEEIRVGEVIHALGGKLYDDEFCERHSGGEEVCRHEGACGIQALWEEVQDAIDRVLNRKTIADLAQTPLIRREDLLGGRRS
ncbi:MAG: Rrf2 family transcriptional regulator [Armatimonadetes bacterium]|nr:MAG: Rrf2 family transcriptional regulator [Armatimonadota bacterium]GIV02635.1 MAG: Rrf2 family transcriptional regulator [Fimbriimonadales bacterium]